MTSSELWSAANRVIRQGKKEKQRNKENITLDITCPYCYKPFKSLRERRNHIRKSHKGLKVDSERRVDLLDHPRTLRGGHWESNRRKH